MKSSNCTAQPAIELFQVVLDALPFCVFWKDRNSVGLGCNQALADVAGLDSPKDYLGKTDYDLPWTTEEADFFRECDRRVMESGEAELNIIESQRQANGRLAWLETSKIPLTDSNGDIIGILGAFHDITERKRLEDENIANQKLDSLGTLAAGLAHDFNNILMMILGSSQLAKMKIGNGAEDTEIVKYLDSIEDATSRASVLTEKFMNYSQRGEVTKSVCNLAEMINESMSFVRSTIKSAIKFKVDDKSAALYADINQIHQVMNNLLLNAAQASANNEEIIVSISKCEIQHSNHAELRAGSYFAIAIKDHGVGISEEQKGDIFKPYFTTKEYGHGLGLSSCETIVKNHNGAIEVESKLGVGSTFTVYLPIFEQNQDIKLKYRPFSNDIIRGSGRILYIEDDLNTQAATLEMLQELGYEVQCYYDVQAAVNYIKKHPESFDIVITDFIIGDFSQGGITILDQVRQLRADCPVVLITGYFEHIEQREETQPQFSYIAQKPIGLAKISQITNRFIHYEGKAERPNNSNSLALLQTDTDIKELKPSHPNDKKILVVDDEPIIIKFLESYLNFHDYHVLSASNGLLALEILNQQAIDLIITDQSMPEMTGIELSQAVKQSFPNIPIIMNSGYSEDVGEHNIKEFGISHFHKKATNAEELVKAISKLL
ncbi:response regulator [Thalassotalea sp. ND16A]|uniref:response regulator n=1 Tax=Thalassotalea sp. ND16A TaxID=1535422 RepID=UPI00051A402C|nr:response regulator [Thalassotalea sp. ND16A]KGJ99071.1 hypothetical protein ND16A_0402 [Thalassotalea sp. ND16A]